MRKLNSSFVTSFLSEAGTEADNKTYFGYVEMDDYYCLAVATGFDSAGEESSARLGVDTVISLFTEHPTMKSLKLREYVVRAHEELKRRSVKVFLKAGILVVVSDYTRLKYVQCGNSMLYVIRSGRAALKSRTCTVYQGKLDEGSVQADGVSGTEHLFSLTGYLGYPRRPELFVSRPFSLMAGDFLLAVTGDVHAKLCSVEILEADEARTEGAAFLEDLEALYLSGLSERVKSYCLAGVDVKKVYIEDTQGKKKRRNRMILICAIAALTLFLVAGGIYLVQKKKRELQQELGSRIDNYHNSGDLYFSAESYDAATKQYEKALEELSKLTDDDKKLEQEEMILEKMTSITDLQKADTALETGDYQMTVKLLKKVREELTEYPELDFGQILSKRLSYANRQIEIMSLKDYSKLAESSGDYVTALDVYNRIYEMQRILEDYEGMKQTRLSMFDLEQVAAGAKEELLNKQESEKAAEAAAEAESGSQAAEAAKQKSGEAQQAVLDKDYQTAINLYRSMREELLAAGAAQDAEQIYQTILSLEQELERQEEEQKAKELETEIQKVDAKKILAEQALLNGNVPEAKRIYQEMSEAYIKLNQIEKASEVYRLLLELKQ